MTLLDMTKATRHIHLVTILVQIHLAAVLATCLDQQGHSHLDMFLVQFHEMIIIMAW